MAMMRLTGRLFRKGIRTMAKSQKKTAAAEKSSRQERQAREGKILVITACVMGAIILAFVLSILAGQIFQSDWFKQRANAVSVDGEKLSVADYNFFFYRSYYEFLNNVGTDETGMYSSPQADIPLSEQYMDEEKNVTWQDYFDNRAQTLLKDTYAYYHLAQNAGFTLTEEMLDDIQYDYDEKIWFEAVEVGHSTEADYLTQNYGAGMTKDIYMKNLTVLYTAKYYKDFYRESIEISPEELDAYYAAHAQDYRSVYYQLFYLSGASSGGMEAAKQHAQELAELHTLEEFEAQCEAYTVYNDDESYWQTASVLRRESCWTSISYLRDWLSGERAYGDTTVAEASNGYYVAFFREESDNNYPTVNLKYFTVSGADANDDVRDYLDAFSKSDGSAQSFFELSDNIRDKDYNRSDNRKISSITYDNATILTVPEDALDWAFDKARTKGDVTTIRAEDGWYVLYFDGFGETASRMIADKQLRTERYKAWTQEVESDVSFAEGRYFGKTASR